MTSSNSFFPDISNATVEILGQGELPEPRRINGSDLFDRSVDSDWVEVEAVVVGVEPGDLAFTVDGRIVIVALYLIAIVDVRLFSPCFHRSLSPLWS